MSRKLLGLLVRRAIDRPSVPVSTTELIAHVWQGERLSQTSAQNRLYVAIARLRTEGLAASLRQVGDGYLLHEPRLSD
ncbi:hypothetical protein EON77_15965 [bacterium]|nr:MAG: hypothetical protein EON77_15965 [bacterium]